ncbi:amidase [Novosphingobium terrae]|uniref:amidase n=1 Tax=Novosphingobium terrae TaxID=2726189 RepID=UPI001F13B84A|nr:amidase [Novosphingobium terrae]
MNGDMMAGTILIARDAVGDGPVTVAVKDCIDILGQPTRGGSGCLDDAAPAPAHADVVANMLARGATIVGKANMHELAYGITGVNGRYGTPANARFPGRIPGGSSSGSAAAVAAGFAAIAIGSDTGGSIRVPATCCGVFGFKPTFGRVSRAGCLPASSSLDCVGPFADNLADIELAMTMIDPGFVPAADRENARLGLVAAEAAEPIAQAVFSTLTASPATMIPIVLPGFLAAFKAGMEIMAAECSAAFGGMVDDERMGTDVRARLRAAAVIDDRQVLMAEQVRDAFTAAVDAALEQVDALALPTLPAIPPMLEEIDADPAVVLSLTNLVRPFNLSGHPALSIPLKTRDGAPAGLQLVGRKGRDAELCAIARFVLGQKAV